MASISISNHFSITEKTGKAALQNLVNMNIILFILRNKHTNRQWEQKIKNKDYSNDTKTGEERGKCEFHV